MNFLEKLTNRKVRPQPVRQDVLVDTILPETDVFSGVNEHLAFLIAQEAETSAAHAKAKEELRAYKENLKTIYETHIESIRKLFPGDS